jgi:hypothetical protein
LRRRVADALADEPSIADLTHSQVERSGRYRGSATTPFRFERGLPFWQTVAPPRPAAGETFAPALTVITEVPDETVDGDRWHACVLAHRRIDETVLAALEQALASPAGSSDSGVRMALSPLQEWLRHTTAGRADRVDPATGR